MGAWRSTRTGVARYARLPFARHADDDPRQGIAEAGAGRRCTRHARLPRLRHARRPARRCRHTQLTAHGQAAARRGSYDGYGNATCRTQSDLDAAWNDLAQEDGLLAEAWAPFEAELSVLVARWVDGRTVVYPVAYSEQRDHRCHAVVVPSGFSHEVENRASELALAAVKAVDGVGIFGVELFALPDGSISVNELAPRPHNTGHYTIEGCATSQFEQHVRAVLDLPPGLPDLVRPAACMVNLLGTREGS